MKEGVVMAEALGQELLIDLYSCDEDAISSATAVQESVATAFDLADLDVDEISCQVMDEEIALLSVAPGFHFTLHTYPALGYVAVDLYSFEQSLPLTLIMKALRKSFRAEKVKATSVQRGDFGNERDMKPRRLLDRYKKARGNPSSLFKVNILFIIAYLRTIISSRSRTSAISSTSSQMYSASASFSSASVP